MALDNLTASAALSIDFWSALLVLTQPLPKLLSPLAWQLCYTMKSIRLINCSMFNCAAGKYSSRLPAVGIQVLACSLQDTLSAAVPVCLLVYIIARCMQGNQQQSST